jgi:hypothetical protein
VILAPPLAIGATGPPVALSVSPARVALVAPASRTIELRNVGSQRVAVDVARKSVDGRGAAIGWLTIRPARLVLRPGSEAVLILRARVGGGARPGDHQLRLLLIARPPDGSRLAVRLRLAIGVRVRVPGRILRRLDVRGVRVSRHAGRRVLLVSVANHGNVTEQVRGHLTVTLLRHGRFVSRLRPRRLRELAPATRAVVALPYTGRVRGLVTAVVRVRVGAGRSLERRYRIRV